jgi:hypothetical protein
MPSIGIKDLAGSAFEYPALKAYEIQRFNARAGYFCGNRPKKVKYQTIN